jgi:hypothetical protein
MKQRFIYPALIILNILVIALFVIEFTGATYPVVGGDYRLFGPRLLDALLHYKVNGFSIQWYTPSFGGGLPAYPNPLQTQFSFPQLFTFFVNPWVAILASSILYMLVGFLVTFLLLRDVLDFKPLAAILGANFLVTSGFFIQQMVSGHADKITFPLIVVPIYAVLNRKLPAWLGGILISLTAAVVLYSGGEYIAVIALFSALVTLPLVFFLKPSLFGWRKMTPVILWGVVLTFLLCGSKLYAVAAFTRSFPRTVQDHYFVDWYTSIGGLIFQLIGVMTTLPILNLIGKNSLVFVARLTQWTGSPYGFWELDSSISPALIILLFWGIWLSLSHKPHLDRNRLFKKVIAGLCLVFSVLLVVQYSTARGFLFDAIKGLPLFMSLRTNSRFTASFALPLAILGAMIFNVAIKGRSDAKTISAFAIFNGISLVSLWAYYLLPLSVQGRIFDINAVLAPYAKIQAGNIFPVIKIIPAMNDYEVFQGRASNTTGHYDVLLGKNSFHPMVRDGSVFDISNGYFNMTDPTGYVFPAENHSNIFSLIPVSDYDKLVQFLDRRQPDWKLPLAQIILDWAAGITFIFEIFAVCIIPARKWLKQKHGHPPTLHPS